MLVEKKKWCVCPMSSVFCVAKKDMVLIFIFVPLKCQGWGLWPKVENRENQCLEQHPYGFGI